MRLKVRIVDRPVSDLDPQPSYPRATQRAVVDWEIVGGDVDQLSHDPDPDEA
jgi:hypothetical protein